jgi:hypothetical protein
MYCKNCGSQLPATTASFCTNCGAKTNQDGNTPLSGGTSPLSTHKTKKPLIVFGALIVILGVAGIISLSRFSNQPPKRISEVNTGSFCNQVIYIQGRVGELQDTTSAYRGYEIVDDSGSLHVTVGKDKELPHTGETVKSAGLLSCNGGGPLLLESSHIPK